MADKYTFGVEAPEGTDFKEKQIKLVKTVTQSEVFSINQFELQISNCDTRIAIEEAKKVDLQAKIDAATAKLG